MEKSTFFTSTFRALLGMGFLLISIAVTGGSLTAAIVSPEVDGSPLLMDCQSSKPTVPIQATNNLSDLTPPRIVQARWSAWLSHLFCYNFPSSWFSPSKAAGPGNHSQQVLEETRSGNSNKAGKPSPIDKKSGSDACSEEKEPGISKLSSSSPEPKGPRSVHLMNHRCVHMTVCTSENKLTKCWRNRVLPSNRHSV